MESWLGPPRECWTILIQLQYSLLLVWSAARRTSLYSLRPAVSECCIPPCSSPWHLLALFAHSRLHSAVLRVAAMRCNRCPTLPGCFASRCPSMSQLL